MRFVPFPSALLSVALAALPGRAQDMDPMAQATGWARADADGSFTFFDPGARKLITWMKDGNLLGHVDLSKLDGPPEFWSIDSYGNAWVVQGTSLIQVDKKGKLGSRVRLPAQVADLAWEPRGMVISYRTAEPYLEKRDYKSGAVAWSWGARPERGSATTSFRIAVTNTNEVVVARGTSMAVDILDLQSGKQLRQATLSYKGAAAPELDARAADRGPLAWWTGKGVALAAVPGSQAPHARMNGLLLARIDYAGQAVDFLPTGLTEDHVFLGVVESEAAFAKPKGGLVFVPLS